MPQYAVLLDGYVTWSLRAKDIRRLETIDHWCLRSIGRTGWIDGVRKSQVESSIGYKFREYRSVCSIDFVGRTTLYEANAS